MPQALRRGAQLRRAVAFFRIGALRYATFGASTRICFVSSPLGAENSRIRRSDRAHSTIMSLRLAAPGNTRSMRWRNGRGSTRHAWVAEGARSGCGPASFLPRSSDAVAIVATMRARDS